MYLKWLNVFWLIECIWSQMTSIFVDNSFNIWIVWMYFNRLNVFDVKWLLLLMKRDSNTNKLFLFFSTTFPQFGYCRVEKYATTESPTLIDGICYLNRNVAYNIGFTMLWFWMAFSLLVSVSLLVYRALTYSQCFRNVSFRRKVSQFYRVSRQ